MTKCERFSGASLINVYTTYCFWKLFCLSNKRSSKQLFHLIPLTVHELGSWQNLIAWPLLSNPSLSWGRAIDFHRIMNNSNNYIKSFSHWISIEFPVTEVGQGASVFHLREEECRCKARPIHWSFEKRKAAASRAFGCCFSGTSCSAWT